MVFFNKTGENFNLAKNFLKRESPTLNVTDIDECDIKFLET